MTAPPDSPTGPAGSGTARAVLVAAGRSTRMAGAGGVRKPLIEVGGRTLLEHACAAFDAAETVVEVVVVAHEDDLERIRELVATRTALAKVRAVVPGGAERADSVRAGATVDGPGAALLCIHDAARPFVRASDVDRVVRAAAESGAALLAVPVSDTLKRSADGRTAAETVERAHLWRAQTPQVFERARFLECLERARGEGLAPTDDAALWERYVGGVTLVRGSAWNRKVTGPEDLELAAALLVPARAAADGDAGRGGGA